jgi:glycosylphosphatidylinositol phospholipase D
LIIGSYDADPNGPFSGAAYVVFGSASGFAASLYVAALPPSPELAVTAGDAMLL